VALNCSGRSQTVRFDAAGQASTLLSSFAKAGQTEDLGRLMLPPYGSWIGQVR